MRNFSDNLIYSNKKYIPINYGFDDLDRFIIFTKSVINVSNYSHYIFNILSK